MNQMMNRTGSRDIGKGIKQKLSPSYIFSLNIVHLRLVYEFDCKSILSNLRRELSN